MAISTITRTCMCAVCNVPIAVTRAFGYLLWLIFLLLLGASPGNLSQSFFDTVSRGHNCNHTNSLQCSGLSGQRTPFPTEKLPTVPDTVSLQLREVEWFLRSFVLIRWEMVQLVPTTHSTASQGSCHVYGTTHWNLPTSPYPTSFCLHKADLQTECTNWYHAVKVRWHQKASSLVKELTDVSCSKNCGFVMFRSSDNNYHCNKNLFAALS